MVKFHFSSGFGPLLLTAVVNGSEPLQDARARIRNRRSADLEVDIVRFNPHNWEKSEPYVNVQTARQQLRLLPLSRRQARILVYLDS
jgi:hypothetical protein